MTSLKHRMAVGGSAVSSSSSAASPPPPVIRRPFLRHRRPYAGRVQHIEPAEHALLTTWTVVEPIGSTTIPDTASRFWVTMSMRRWPRSTRCWAAALAPSAVVDVDAGNAWHGDLVDEDQWQLASFEPIDCGRVRVAGVDESAIHRHVARRDHVRLFRGRQQRERKPGGRQFLGNGAEERGRNLIGERVPQRIGEQHPDGARSCLGAARAAGSGPAYPSSLCGRQRCGHGDLQTTDQDGRRHSTRSSD